MAKVVSPNYITTEESRMNDASHSKIKWFILILALPILGLFDIIFGSAHIPLQEFFDLMGGKAITRSNEIIILQSRLPKALTAILAGGAISLSGLLMQTLFRNPLAGPYLLGVSSGAGLGVAILVMGSTFFGFQSIFGWTLTVAALSGSVGILLLLFLVSLKVKDIMTLLIVGIMVGSIASAIIGIFQYFSSDAQLKSFLIWTLGSLEGLKEAELMILTAALLVLTILAISMNKSLNLLLLGESYAKSLGVRLLQSRLLIIFISGALAGLITAYCGPIGFVGIVVPHICRLWFKSSSHLILIPASVLLGANVLLLSDILSHLPSGGISLPINSVTAILGIPVILWLLLSRQNISKTF